MLADELSGFCYVLIRILQHVCRLVVWRGHLHAAELVHFEPGFDFSVIVERFLFGTTTYYFRSRERIVYTYTKNVRF